MSTVLAVDLGGSGSRARLAGPGGAREASGERLRVSAGGLVAAPLVTALVERLGARAGDVDAVCVGSSGILTLSDGPQVVLDAVRSVLGDLPTVVASDAVTSAVGALDGRAGAVVLTGTGSTAVGTDLAGCWRKVDGWGHVLGDAGSGAWIGMQALQTALEQHDGRRTDAAGLLAATVARLGVPESWPRQIYTREDRAGVLASVVPDVVALAADDDGVAREILRRAGRELARSLVAALRAPVPPVASWTGGVFGAALVLETMLEELTRLRPDVVLEPPRGTSLDGAELLARRALTGDLQPAEPLLTVRRSDDGSSPPGSPD
ncbi:N-acetylglucosamine kinase [Georgenia satyanarayanai]|uniref:N-acetylglucosamine kinase n=1 Tax=Georgenia satyanarayanai TaxID=860221 RepID=UPI0012657C02|nr:BadF/BadG/BcrA/BcrD ATPase family protein [Georgenia satyanarayanai]